MNLEIVKESMFGLSDQEAIEEYAENSLTIHLDENLPLRAQRTLVLHAVLENYFPCLTHEKVEELEELMIDALDKIGYES